MSDIVDVAFSSVRALPPEQQEEVARIVMQLVGLEGSPYLLDEEERRDLEEADAEIGRGELASEEEVSALWSKSIPAPS